jgi:hypothetical protein
LDEAARNALRQDFAHPVEAAVTLSFTVFIKKSTANLAFAKAFAP